MKEEIDFFFMNPNEFKDEPGKKSILYLLRRDIMTCFGINANTNKPIPTAAYFPGVMAVMAGIDLLAKFYAGNDKTKESGSRFLTFTSKYIDIENQEIIYGLRNSLMHSFGTYSKGKDGAKKRFRLDTASSVLVQQIETNQFLINIELLRDRFESACEQYYQDVKKSEELQQKFMNMMDDYGYIYIQ